MYKLVLVRHGQSVWNAENRFTGWTDVDLSPLGIEEARSAGKKLKEAGFTFDLAFESVLKRVTRTLDIILEEMGENNVEIRKSWRLNERHYGALQGLNKSETAKKYGEEQVKMWRRGFDVPIPLISAENDMYPGNDPLYKDLDKSDIPLGETLKQAIERVLPYWDEEIVRAISSNRKIIIVASGTSLRGLVKHIESMSDQEVIDLNIPTGIPFVYNLDESLKPINKKYLATDEELEKAIAKVVEQGKAA